MTKLDSIHTIQPQNRRSKSIQSHLNRNINTTHEHVNKKKQRNICPQNKNQSVLATEMRHC